MIGKRLKELRTSEGLTQQELAKILNVSSMSISFYENEQRKPDSDFIISVSKYFGVSTDYLLGLINAKDKENIYTDVAKYLSLYGSVRLIDVVSQEDLYDAIVKRMKQYINSRIK